MAYSVHFAEEALADQANIVAYLVESLRNSNAARHFLGELEEIVFELEQTPSAFPRSREPRLKNLGYRKCLFMNYVALFRIDGDAVYITHIFHQNQDYAKLV